MWVVFGILLGFAEVDKSGGCYAVPEEVFLGVFDVCEEVMGCNQILSDDTVRLRVRAVKHLVCCGDQSITRGHL